MKIKTILLITLALILSGCGNQNISALEKYLEATSYVKNEGWKVDEVEKEGKDFYAVTLKMSKSYESSYKFMYALSSSDYERMAKVKSLHSGFLMDICLELTADNTFWDSLTIDSFYFFINVDNRLLNFDNDNICKRPKK